MNREAIYGGLFTQLSAIPGFVTKSRLLKHWTDVPSDLQPAIYMAQGKESANTKPRLPTEWLLNVTLYIYVRTDGITAPATVLNPLIDAVVGVVQQRHVITGNNNLGGIAGVEWARVEGAIDTDEGTLGNQAVAIIPVQILVTD